PAASKPVAVVPAPVKAPAPAAVPAPAAPAAGSAVYVVKSGDTLHRIAKTNGMTVAQLKEMNHLASDMLKIGQKLVVKGSATAPAPAPAAVPPAPAATPAPAPASAVAAVAPAVSAPAAVSGMQSYTVAKGDTLTKIAKLFKVTPAAIMAANSPKLNDPKKLKIGEVLTIPVKAERREVSQGPAAPAQGSGSPVPTARTSSPDLVMNK
ncbi:MAG TPA: LysM peptidoglycan-binding domain-containing protein, partial [Candidatus Methylacidiphilales bacterium]